MTERGRRAPRASRATTPEVARKDVDDQAGFAVRVGVQHESRLTVDLVPLIH
jgi:hypothetical protein